MRGAFADPPYPGMARRYPEKQEVYHGELITRLLAEYDCWALSTSSVALQEVLSLCPPEVRVMAWVKPFASFKPNVNPAFAWEPVLVWHARKRDRKEPTVRDWISAGITLKKGLVGAKPPAFCYWLFSVLGLRPGDELVDLFPGTGIVGRCYELFQRQGTPQHPFAFVQEAG